MAEESHECCLFGDLYLERAVLCSFSVPVLKATEEVGEGASFTEIGGGGSGQFGNGSQIFRAPRTTDSGVPHPPRSDSRSVVFRTRINTRRASCSRLRIGHRKDRRPGPASSTGSLSSEPEQDSGADPASTQSGSSSSSEPKTAAAKAPVASTEAPPSSESTLHGNFFNRLGQAYMQDWKGTAASGPELKYRGYPPPVTESSIPLHGLALRRFGDHRLPVDAIRTADGSHLERPRW